MTDIARPEGGDSRRGPGLAHPVVLIGPEGGWSEAERTLAIPRISLGSHVLRAETAAITAGALLCGLRAGVLHGAEPAGDPG